MAGNRNAHNDPVEHVERVADYDDHYARWSYEQLLLQQPHIEFLGLWRKGYHHFVVCPAVDQATTLDGEDLRVWFHHKCRVITSRIEIVNSQPSGAVRVADRSATDRAMLAGAPRNVRDLFVEFAIGLPGEFPPFTLENPGTEVVMVTSRELDPGEEAQARSAYASLGYVQPLGFSTQAAREFGTAAFRSPHVQGDIDLIPSRRLVNKCGRALRFLVEDDEQFWAESRNEVLATFDAEPGKRLPDGWSTKPSLGCLVNASVSPPDNVRTHLSLYDTVYLALPLASHFEQNCDSLGVTPDELRELVETDRVRILLPQAVDRYPLDWLSAVADSSPNSLLFSRRLAAATISDARRRLPFLYPPLSPRERHVLLNAIGLHAEELVGGARSADLVRFLSELGNAWSQAEWTVHARGAMGTSHLGVGRVASTMYEQISGRDLRLELWFAAQNVEWAGALGAHVFGSTSRGYDETKACDLVAGVYGQVAGRSEITASPAMLAAVSELLALDNSVPVVEFATEFGSADVRRLRQLVGQLSRDNVDPEFLADAIRKFNAEVRHYEKRPDLLKSVNVVGLMSASAVALGAVDPSIRDLVPLAGTLLGFLVNRIVDEVPRRSALAGTVVDYLNAMLAGKTSAAPVLVARARKDVARLKG